MKSLMVFVLLMCTAYLVYIVQLKDNQIEQLQDQYTQLNTQINDNYFVMSMDASCSAQLEAADFIQLKVIR